MTQRQVDCVILWHHFDADGKLYNASATHLLGSMMNLQERLTEARDKCKKDQAVNRPYAIAVQIIPAMVQS